MELYRKISATNNFNFSGGAAIIPRMTSAFSPPPSLSLRTDALARVFDNVVSSQKFLWLLAILDCLSVPKYRKAPVIPMDLLVCHMLNTAKRTLEQFRLQQASQHDKFHSYLEVCRQRSGIFPRELDYSFGELPGVCGRIPRSVYTPLTASTAAPYRMLVPFLPSNTKITMGNVRREAKEMSGSDSPAPYHFSDDGGKIIVHSEWAGYFADNADILRGWVLWHWTRFLESRNSGTPSLTAKITGVVRGSMSVPCKLWDAVILRAPDETRCIYSGERLELDNYGVDHYLPWKFVAHDNFWNLVPTLKGVNSSKGDTLPDARYLDKLAGIHRVAIATYHERPDLHKECGGLMIPYLTDLQVSAPTTPPAEDEIRGAYRRVVPAMEAFAKNQGFRVGWKFRKTGAGKKRTQSPLVS